MMPRKFLPHHHRLSRNLAFGEARAPRLFAFAAALLVSTTPLHAVTRSWSGATSTEWAINTNWLGGAVPATGDSVSIDTTSPNKTIFGSGASSVATITVGSAGVGVVTGDLTVTGGGQLTAAQVWAGQGTNAIGTVSVNNAALLNMSGNFYVADSGTGTLLISAAGNVKDADGYIGYSINSIGVANVTGANSSWVNGNLLSIGSSGIGILQVVAGGKVSDGTAYLGGSTALGSGGSVLVSDPGSSWGTLGELRVGDTGGASLDIKNAGVVTDDTGIVGYQSGSKGVATIDGAGSTWTSSSNLFIGQSGSGMVTISNGAVVQAASTSLAYGVGTPGTGQVIVDGAGSSLTQTNLVVGYDGAAQLIVRNGGSLSVTGTPLYLAANPASTGVLAIGAVRATRAQAPGTINASNIYFGGNSSGGNGFLLFNHTSTNYTFAQSIGSGSTPGTIETFAGTTSLTADSSAFTGKTLVVGGTLRVNGKLGTGQVAVTGGPLGGSGSIAGPVSVQSGGHLAPGN